MKRFYFLFVSQREFALYAQQELIMGMCYFFLFAFQTYKRILSSLFINFLLRKWWFHKCNFPRWRRIAVINTLIGLNITFNLNYFAQDWPHLNVSLIFYCLLLITTAASDSSVLPIECFYHLKFQLMISIFINSFFTFFTSL